MARGLVMFFLGSAVTAGIIHHHNTHHYYHDRYSYPDEQGRRPIHHQHHGWGCGTHRHGWRRSSDESEIAPADTRNVSSTPAPALQQSPSQPTMDEFERKRREEWRADQAKWEENQRKFADMSDQAIDAMAEMSEATLESVLSTVETLKVKLAEQRAQRELYNRRHSETQEQQEQHTKQERRSSWW